MDVHDREVVNDAQMASVASGSGVGSIGRGSRGSGRGGRGARGRGIRGSCGSHDDEVPLPSSMEVDDSEMFSPAVSADGQMTEVPAQERLQRPCGSRASRGARGGGVGKGGRGVGKRGRGARGRGSRGQEDDLPSSSTEVVWTNRGGRASAPPLRGGLVSRRGQAAARKPSRPNAIDKLQIMSVDLLPKGTPQEHPLHPKKRRAWDPLNPSLATGVTVEVEVIEVEKDIMEVEEEQEPPHAGTPEVQAQEPAPSPGPSQSPAFPPSPALFLECPVDSSSRASTPRHVQVARQPPRRPLRDVDIEEHLNYGSESDDSDENDEDMVPMLVSRVFMGAMDTPLDDQETAQLFEGPSVPLADEVEGAVRPNNFFHFEWRKFPNPPIPPKERREAFTAVGVGPTVPCQDPYEIFVSIWNINIMQHIVCETNKYAQDTALKKMRDNTLGPRSRICYWEDTSIDELYTYFAIILAMGVVVKSRLEDLFYWRSRDIPKWLTGGPARGE